MKVGDMVAWNEDNDRFDQSNHPAIILDIWHYPVHLPLDLYHMKGGTFPVLRVYWLATGYIGVCEGTHMMKLEAQSETR